MKLSGRHLSNSLQVDLDSRRSAIEVSRWYVRIGELNIEDVQLLDSQTLSVTLPATLALGVHDVEVTTPGGAHATLNDGLTVIDGDPSAPSWSSAEGEGVWTATVSQQSTTTSEGASSPMPHNSSADDAASSQTMDGASASTAPTLSTSVAPRETTSSDVVDVTAAPDAGDTTHGATSPEFEALRFALAHRYSFDQAGTTVRDSVGGADGMFIAGALDGVSGAARFTGAGEYIDLPSGLISGRDAVTIEVWLIWDVPNSGADYSWQRVFDFGSSSALEGQQGSQDTHLFLSPRSGGVAGALHLAYRGDLTGSVTLNTTSPLTPAVVEHVAAVVDGTSGSMELFVNGVSVASRALGFPLSRIVDHNNWLGRSQVLGDPAFQGQLLDFRIYAGALPAEILTASYVAGPDAQF